MFRLLHASHRVNPIAADFDNGVHLVKLMPAPRGSPPQFPDGCSPPECQRHASTDVGSFCESRDSEMTDIQAAQQQQLLSTSFGSSSSMLLSSPRNGLSSEVAGGDCDRPVSTPVQTRASARLACSTPSVQNAQHLQNCLEELRQTRPRRFYEICRVHLAFVTDVPADFLQDRIDGCPTAVPAVSASNNARTPSARMLMEKVCRSMRHQQHTGDQVAFEAAADESLNAEILASIERLIRLLEGRLDAEGIFRKSGQVGRQRQLRQFLQAEPAVASVGTGSCGLVEAAVLELRCCVHDIAGVLKASLGELQHPLLTDRLQPYFLQVADLNPNKLLDVNGNPSGPASSVSASRQMRGYRILVQLLPRENRNLLRRLLRLLRQVAELPRTLMTPENLGTVFGPLLLCPRQMQSTDNFARVIALSNEAVAYMIRYVDEIFMVPEHLAIDAMRGLERSRCRSRSRSCVEEVAAAAASHVDNFSLDNLDDEDDEAVDVCVAFVDRTAASRVDGREYTQLQVAELYAAVQSMPEGPRKAALVKKFNAANGGLGGCGVGGQSRSPFKRRVGVAGGRRATPAK